MRVLVAGRKAKLLAAMARTFARDLQINTAATTLGCIHLMKSSDFDLIVACENLADGSGLQALSYAAMKCPDALRIFAASPATLKSLEDELGLFKLFSTLSYPVNLRSFSSALELAQRRINGEQDPINVKHVVLSEEWETLPQGDVALHEPSPSNAVTVASTSARNGPARQALVSVGGSAQQASPARQGASARGAATSNSSAPVASTISVAPHDVPTVHGALSARTPGKPPAAQQVQATSRPTTTAPRSAMSARAPAAPRSSSPARSPSPARSNSTARPTSIAAPAATPKSPSTPKTTASAPVATAQQANARRSRPPAYHPPLQGVVNPSQSAVYQRALAKRNSGKVDASDFAARREPGTSEESLAQLARLSATSRPLSEHRYLKGVAPKRTALYVGTGVFVAISGAVLTFFLLNADNSVAHSNDAPHIASLEHFVPSTVFPWKKQEPQQHNAVFANQNGAPNFAMPADSPAPAEFGTEAAHPAPPQPNPPPGPSEPPSVESLLAGQSDAPAAPIND